MSRCDACAVEVEGAWSTCPLCAAPLSGTAVADPLPAVRLGFSRRRVLTWLFLTSLLVIGASFLAQLLFDHEGIGALRAVWLGIASMWLLVLAAVRKRSNVAKGAAYLVVIVGLVSTYWDYLTGWNGWALTFVVPIVCGSAIVAVLITVLVLRMEVADHIVYTGLTALLGLVPLLFLVLGWVTTPLPSAICGALGFLALVALQAIGGSSVRHELAKRLHL